MRSLVVGAAVFVVVIVVIVDEVPAAAARLPSELDERDEPCFPCQQQMGGNKHLHVVRNKRFNNTERIDFGHK